jgi:poly-gamma-glutamate capsule biosynthesis protein CapA/YwtB (metallophosphatase superfamily)
VLASAKTPGVALSAQTVPSVSETPAVALATLQTAAEAARDDTITIVAVGDLLFDLSPRTLIAKKGGRAPLAKVETLLADADITIGNLEGPLSNRGTHVGGKTPDHIFEGDPRAVQGLTASGFDFMALANNHIMDHGGIALRDTLDTLDKAGIAHAGAGMNKAAAWKPAIIERSGRKIAYLSFSQIVPGGFTPSATRPGMALGRDMSKVASAIRAAKKSADYVIVSFHWGVEQSYRMNSSQIRDARRSIDAGADMVLSHHPHVMQGIEFYKGGLIAYSLGDFVFPYKTVEGRKSIILKASLGPGGVTDVTAVPVYMGQWGRPSVQTGSSAAGILGKLKKISAPRGTRVIIKGSRARIVPR